MTPEAIKNFSEENTIYNIQHNYEGSNTNATVGNHLSYHDCTFNPLDELLKVIEENKRLYERLLESEREKVAMLENILETKNGTS